MRTMESLNEMAAPVFRPSPFHLSLRVSEAAENISAATAGLRRGGTLWRTVRGFSLVEVVIALGVISFAVMALINLLPVGLETSWSASQQTAAANVATAILSDLTLSASPAFKGTSSTRFALPVNTNYTNTIPATLLPAAANFRVGVVIGSPSAALQPRPVRILVTWPAAAIPANAAGSYEVFTFLPVKS